MMMMLMRRMLAMHLLSVLALQLLLLALAVLLLLMFQASLAANRAANQKLFTPQSRVACLKHILRLHR